MLKEKVLKVVLINYSKEDLDYCFRENGVNEYGKKC
jgi:hypothetical protein